VKITANRSDLARALKLAASTADPKSTLPVLGCVYLVAEGKKQLHITA
jgi:DNA polymerase III sliding clamp (beta) subunit (PCNA family)